MLCICSRVLLRTLLARSASPRDRTTEPTSPRDQGQDQSQAKPDQLCGHKPQFDRFGVAVAPFDFRPAHAGAFFSAELWSRQKNRGRFPTTFWVGEESDPKMRFGKHEIGSVWGRHGSVWAEIWSSQSQMGPGPQKTLFWGPWGHLGVESGNFRVSGSLRSPI